MSIKISQIPAFKDNYIWVIFDLDAKICICFDPGEARPVKAFLTKNGLELTHIFLTHHHWDHTNGVKALMAHYHPQVIGPVNEAIIGLTRAVKEGDVIDVEGMADLRFHVIHTPGHTRGHVAYYGRGMLFSGDTLFTGGCGRLFEGTADEMFDSLNKLKLLPPSTRVYCGHEYTVNNLRFAQMVEPHNKDIAERISQAGQLRKLAKPTVPEILEIELATNPFLRTDQKNVIAAAEHYSGRELPTGSDVLAVLRHWKDNV